MTICLSSVRKLFGASAALNDISLQIDSGDFFVVLGPSGCGKSTLLRAIAGLDPITSGEISIAGKKVAGPGLHVDPEERNVGVVFQSYALWPHLTVRGNVAFPLETAHLPRREVRARADKCLATVELMPFAERKPADLSGGQRQRVALARCLAQEANTILMDEPLANLDPHLRTAMEGELAEFHARSGATTLFITHDQREAMALATKVALMWEGRVLQADTPEMLYERPANERVASFIGRSSVVDATVLKAGNGEAVISLAGRQMDVSSPFETAEGACRLVVRPEHVRLGGARTDTESLSVRVDHITYRGGFYEARLGLAEGGSLLANLPHRAEVGENLSVTLSGGWVLPRA